MSLVSIIVPVYNTEKYIDRCLKSLLSQTHTELEILLIDDGSTDSSGVICDGYAERDGRVRVFHLENGGVSRARNFGLSEMRGDFVIFVDSDDHLAEDAVERELSVIEDNGCDLAIFSLIFDDGKSQSTPKLKSGAYQPKDYLLDPEQDIGCLCSPCNKIYKSRIIKKRELRFTDGVKYGEDFIFNSRYLTCAESLFVSSDAYYYYDISREGSGVKRLYREYDDFIVAIDDAFRAMLSRLGIPDGELRADFMADRWDYAFNICISSRESIDTRAEILSAWLRRVPDCDLGAFCSRGGALSVFCNIRAKEKDFTDNAVKRILKKHLRKENFRKTLVKIKRFLRRIK